VNTEETDVSPKLTIITPVLNDLQGLKLCANSIGVSTGEFEHIIVDGGSSDGSFEYAIQLASRPFTRVIKQRSNGIYGAFNDGLSVAEGYYIIYLHCGDELYLDAVINLVRAEDGCDVIAASCSQKIGDTVQTYLRSSRSKLSPASMSILQPSLIIRREKYYEVGGFDNFFRISADVDCVLKILNLGSDIRYSDEIVVHMEEFGLSKESYFRKLWEHTIIKFRHSSIFRSALHIPQKLFLDFLVIPVLMFFKRRLFPRP
jgi:glycosyltransferase involved in cell wall biosynthesis